MGNKIEKMIMLMKTQTTSQAVDDLSLEIEHQLVEQLKRSRLNTDKSKIELTPELQALMEKVTVENELNFHTRKIARLLRQQAPSNLNSKIISDIQRVYQAKKAQNRNTKLLEELLQIERSLNINNQKQVNINK